MCTLLSFRNDAEAMFGGHKIFAAEEMFDIFDLDKDDELGEEHVRQLPDILVCQFRPTRQTELLYYN